jgi:hypothetical protein
MKTITFLFAVALVTSSALLWSVTRPAKDFEPAPCTLHPCACEEADDDCVQGVKVCYLEGGECVCRCVV